MKIAPAPSPGPEAEGGVGVAMSLMDGGHVVAGAEGESCRVGGRGWSSSPSGEPGEPGAGTGGRITI